MERIYKKVDGVKFLGVCIDQNCFFCILMLFAMYQTCLILFYMLMIQMFSVSMKILMMCKIVSVGLDKLSTWFA